MNFTKMNGAGNDFVITDNRTTKTNFTPKTIEKLCDRNRGIGADGFMSVESPENVGLLQGPREGGGVERQRFRLTV